MDLEFRGPNPLTYIVGEHARAVLAIQDLQREVNALLNFRDYVLHALPHLKSRAPAEGVSSEGSTQVAPHSTVVDSGFSTDKASTSMGKSSSFSGGAGEPCGESSRWEGALDDDDAAATEAPLGSCEDELWQLLEVIQRKGTRLRGDLERAELSEREHLPGDAAAAAAAEGGLGRQPQPHAAPKGHHQHDFWPHSLPAPPGPAHRYDYYGFEPFVEMDRLRLDRSYLLSRIAKAETDAAVSQSRLIDLHTQMLGLSAEKRRLEDALHVTVQDAAKIDSYLAYHQPPASKHALDHHAARLGGHRQRSAVTVNSSAAEPPHYPAQAAWIDEDIVLPRILKVPIRDKGEDRIGAKAAKDTTANYSKDLSSGSKLRGGGTEESTAGEGTTIAHHRTAAEGSSPQRQTTVSHIGARGGQTMERVVIERQRACSKVDGGLSMPTSLLKGSKIKVNPDKQRISAILREKDVLTLQKQLLTTVMETEVLKRQLECCSEEWMDRCSQFEQGQRKNCDIISSLTDENRQLKHKLERQKPVSRADFGATAKPVTRHVAVSTHSPDDAHQPTLLYQPAPAQLNVKYDVVVHEEAPILVATKTSASGGRNAVEKPPRKRVVTTGGGGPPLRVGSGSANEGTLGGVTLSPRAVPASSAARTKSIAAAAVGGSRMAASASTPSSSLTGGGHAHPRHHSRASSGIGGSTVAPVFRRDATTARSGTALAAPSSGSLRGGGGGQPPFNKVPFLSHSTLAFSGLDSMLHKSNPADARSESFIPRATSQLGGYLNTRGRHLPKSPSSVVAGDNAPSSKYMPIDKSPRSYVRYSISPGSSGSGIPSLIRGTYGKCDSHRLTNYSQEWERGDCSADEDGCASKGTGSSKQTALWRKPSGAVRIRNVGRPSVMSYLGKDSG